MKIELMEEEWLGAFFSIDWEMTLWNKDEWMAIVSFIWHLILVREIDAWDVMKVLLSEFWHSEQVNKCLFQLYEEKWSVESKLPSNGEWSPSRVDKAQLRLATNNKIDNLVNRENKKWIIN